MLPLCSVNFTVNALQLPPYPNGTFYIVLHPDPSGLRPGTCYTPEASSTPGIAAATVVLPNPLGSAPVLLGTTPLLCVPLGGIRDVQIRGSFTLPADSTEPITVNAQLTLAPVGGQDASPGPASYPSTYGGYGAYGGYGGYGSYGAPSAYGSPASSPRSLRSPPSSSPSSPGLSVPPSATDQPRTIKVEASAPTVPVASLQLLVSFLLGGAALMALL